MYSAIGGFLNVFLNLLLIPSFGIVGCAFATLGAQLMSNAYLQGVVRQMHPFHLLPRLKNAIIATVIMAVAAFAFQFFGAHVILNIALSALIFGGVLYFRREPLLSNLALILRPTVSAARENRGWDAG